MAYISSKHLPHAFLAFALICSQATVAVGDNTADEAELEFEIGAEAYQRGDYRTAVEHFLASNRLSPNRNVAFNIARAFEKLGRIAEAYRYYQSVDSDAARASLQELHRVVVVLNVTTSPPGATLYVDRVELGSRGEAPNALGLLPGKYKVIAKLAGYRPAEVQLEALAAGSKRDVHLELTALRGHLELTTPGLTGVSVTAEVGAHRASCIAPCTVDLPPGSAHVRASRAGYRSTDQYVQINPEQRGHAILQLEPSTGVISVEADEVGALVEVDGVHAGYTPALLRVPVGKHRVRVSYPGFNPIDRPIDVTEARPERIAVTMTRSDTVTGASRRAETTVEAPSSVTVIPREELALFRFPTVLEALRGSPGVFQWDDRAYPTIGIRGQGRLGSYGNRVLVLLDDHSLNDSWAGSSYGGYQHRTDLSDIERIEIIRGPGSVLYGTNAFAGVVNVVTRPGKPRTQTEGGLSVAQDGMGRIRLRQDLSFGPDTKVWASAGYGRSAGTSFQTIDAAGLPITTGPEFDAMESGTAELRFTHKALTLTAFGTSADKKAALGYYGTNFNDLRNQNRDTRGFAEIRFEPKVSEQVSLNTIASGDLYHYDGTFMREYADGGIERDQFQGYWAGLEQRINYAPFKPLRVTVGGVGQYHFAADQKVTYDLVPSLDETRNVYVAAGYGVADLYLPHLHVSAGARLDAYGTAARNCPSCTRGTFGSSVNPRVAVITNLYAQGTTKLLVAKAFRAPTVSEMFYNDGGQTQRSSPDLQPEEIWSAELQHIHQFTHQVQASLSAYLTRTTGSVVDAAYDPQDPFHYVNSPVPLATAGIEARLRRDWAQGWMLEVSYSLMAAAYLESERLADLVTWQRSPDFQEVANVPNHLWAFKGAVPILRKALTLGTRVTAETARFTWQEARDSGAQDTTPGFVLWDLVLGGQEPTTGLSYTFGVYNAFDTRYRLPVGSEFYQSSTPQPGRTFLADVSIQF
jgi:outer membrane receptor protein involved in Fe transport